MFCLSSYNFCDYEATAWEYGQHSGTTHSDAQPVPGVIVYRFGSPLIFSNAEAFKDTGKTLLIQAAEKDDLPNCLVIDFEEVTFVDATGAAAVSDLFAYLQRYDVELLLARVHSVTHQLLQVAGVLDEIGEGRIYTTVRKAVEAATNTKTTEDIKNTAST